MAKFAKAHGLAQSKARQVLETLLTYTLHKPRRRHFPTLPVIAFKVDQQWMMDLMDVQKLAKWNKGQSNIVIHSPNVFKQRIVHGWWTLKPKTKR